MLASGSMKQSIVGQAGGEEQYQELGVNKRPSNPVDPEEAEERMLKMVQRNENWNI